ncbi:hypothetical protein P152DRAFT_459530 [Eremomyces bilateralis CBS 781.70]|uniref:FYVE-type domain-containing protein n=1 Tax=Eremomyces bilateralis CBS 781.70 TaxID=1392243 RepID=A0A6G1G0T3_9PEZI|nr:uncharacterized protein P152DRAFT_459530 [Eremomyces bilateralis CBS 781.70]KAF1811592.1 hypothetical protein P152DRAFT_459530 [Eremomyces bilateralis CBS 781.70]
MASRRSLGGGRVLGSGRNLTPASAAAEHIKRNISPSGSSLSVISKASESPASSAETQDISSKVSLSNAAAATASSRMVCPICNDEMVTLLQLNRHLDDNHANLEVMESDEVKTWFRTQMVKAKKFQPLVALNQKLKGLDVFESNNTPPPLTQPLPPTSGHTSPQPDPIDPDELVTRSHWQKPTSYDSCSDPMCNKRLGGVNGSVNCRKCGKLFCEEYTMYQMKLSRSATHEPVRGIWCRVCETCYKSREGYNDYTGFARDHTSEFMTLRRKTVDKAYLEVSRLEARLTKLTQLLANPPPMESPNTSTGLWSMSGAKTQQRALEQSVIAWEDDAEVMKCPFCQQDFSTYSFRRHHCRLCGRVVCGDLRTGCSKEIGLSVATVTDAISEKRLGKVGVDVRMCKDCSHTLFSRVDFARELAHKPPDQRSYENLIEFQRGIRLLLPKFQRLLVALQDAENPPSHDHISDATKVRKRLMDAFSQYDTAARRIRDLPSTSPGQLRLQKAVYQQAYNFLHLHMLPLKSLPKILKHASPHGAGHQKPSHSGRPPSALSAIKFNDIETSSQMSGSTAMSQMEAEEKELRERLIVLEEQKFFVSEMVADANRRRKFDEVSSLALNLEDLSREIDQINSQLAQLDFAAVYEAGLASPPATS